MGMKLTRRTEGGPALSLVPLIDVMLILLVFFMVTSTYLDLDMIPMVDQAEAPPTGTGPAAETQRMLLRIDPTGQVILRSEAVSGAELQAEVSAALSLNPLLSVLILPSERARTQDLVSAMDLLTAAGVTQLRLLRFEAEQ